ncbi:hypothetical protein [Nocardioides sp.]|uniref:hypothetical protein n=1 Tax=Nocardioides sp. TaxID=35761 RepID=UPI003784FFC7
MPPVPADLVLASDADALGVLLLRCYRSLSLVIIGLGICVATWSKAFDEVDADLSTPDGIVHAFVTPFAPLALGLLVRVSVTPLAWVLAMLFVALNDPVMSPPPTRDTAWKRLMDQLRMASAYRALRWTSSVRDAAVGRLGPPGRLLVYADGVLRLVAALTIAVWLVSLSL